MQSVITLLANEQLGFIKIDLHWNLLSQLSFYHLKYITIKKNHKSKISHLKFVNRCTINKFHWLKCN